MSDDSDIRRRLHDAAERLESATDPVTASEVRRGGAAVPHLRRTQVLLAAAAVGVLIAGAFALLARDDTSTTEIGPTTASTSIASTTPAPSVTTTAPADPTTTQPAAPPLDLAALPSEGLAVSNPDGTTDLYDLDGNLLVTTATPEGTNNARQLAVSTGSSRLELPIPIAGALEVPPGCTSAVATPAGRLAICDEGRAIHRVEESGQASVVMGEPETDPAWTAGLLGQWTQLIPSPDGTRALATWSGECEAPTAFVLGSGNRAAFQPGEHWWESPETNPLGWVDGEPIVEAGHGLCSSALESPGIYRITADGSTPSPIVAFDDEPGQTASFWRMGCNCGNELERAMVDAIEWLGYEGCCGEDSHGGPGAAAGVIYEGTETGIWAQPTAMAVDAIGPGQVREETGPVGAETEDPPIEVFSPFDPAAFGPTVVTFTCGDYTFVLSQMSVDSPDVDSMLMLADELVPGLGCTLRPSALKTSTTTGQNELEQWVFSALDERYPYGCCREPSEGGDDVAYGVVFEDSIIPIFGDLTTTIVESAPVDLTATELTFLDGAASLVESSEGTVVLATCDDYTLTFGWYEDTSPDVDKIVRLGEDLISRMPCDLREPAIG